MQTNPPTVEEFGSWLSNSKPNDKYIYYKGETLTFSHLTNKIRKETWDRAIEGRIYLLQRKISVGVYEFIAVKASYPPLDRLVPIGEKSEPIKMRIQTYSNRRTKLIERVMS